jgi:hypothetical protein
MEMVRASSHPEESQGVESNQKSERLSKPERRKEERDEEF